MVLPELFFAPQNLYLERQEYYIEGQLHREDSPALLWFYPDGKMEFEAYFFNGYFHREDGPAEISYYPNGQINTERYLVHNVLHREDGPAYVRYNKNGLMMRSVSCLEGKPYEFFLNQEPMGFMFVEGVLVLV